MTHVEHLTVGPLACTCTIVADTQSGQAVVVDGGDEAPRIAARLEALGVRATYLLHTHAHIDHIGALSDLRELTNARGLLHPADLPLYATLREQARWLGCAPPHVVELDGELAHGDRIAVGAASLDVLHTPGHTPGSVSFAVAAGERTMLLTGDTLFAGSVGRWDLGGTSLADIVQSIREHLLPFSDSTVVIPGHGAATTIGTERRSNPFLVA
ncbi:MAG TPA: MBL fold metallo-hydrolase [Candidatus Acidoferrales bacterium]|nr:MBL fold metallo-hydrolase [Candidatus Acidoferrales bacterium]